ncbi:glycosyltransferase family 2 protein [Pseudolysinimonas kribbensis]
MPTVHRRPSDHAITWGRLAIVATVLAWLAYVVWTIVRQFIDRSVDFAFTMQAISYVVVVTFLTLSALMYLVARQGALERFRTHSRVPRAELDRHFADRRSSITVLVPSYAEEPEVVRQTLWSAALQEFPSVRVMLLVDDPPSPADPVTRARLDRTRAIATGIQEALAEPAARMAAAERAFVDLGRSSWVSPASVRDLAGEYAWAAGWLNSMAARERVADHVDRFFVDQVLGGLAEDLAEVSTALLLADEHGEAPTRARMLELHRRLVWLFQAELGSFERKLYASLPHDANKAMNLNAYIGLMGGRYRFDDTPKGVVLRPVEPDRFADLEVPDSEYLLTLDADSLLLRDYCVRLVYLLEQPENDRVAVVQTPYSSYRGATTRIERLAGATTDLQHIQHQGMSRFGATFWVGANAVIRKEALKDIEEVEQVGGFEVRRYVQDRTVIEDTESSVDLGTHGWSLVNYPERLSYSATPPDFGSLVVQRRRWANGGLLILPKLIRQVGERRRTGRRVSKTELLLRVNYMASIAWASFGLLFLLAFPYDSRLLSPFVLLAALPYFLCMGADLRSMRYRFSDVLRIYGFNLILLPVNLAGVLKSLQQAITNKKIPFARTPKVRNRTAAPALYVIAPFLVIGFSVFTLVRDVEAQNWGNAAFAAFNAVLASWATLSYIGIGAALVDIGIALRDWLFPARPSRRGRGVVAPIEVDWREVLYSGAAPTAARTRDDERVAA